MTKILSALFLAAFAFSAHAATEPATAASAPMKAKHEKMAKHHVAPKHHMAAKHHMAKKAAPKASEPAK